MTSEADRLAALLERLGAEGEPPSRPVPPFGGPVGELIYSFLVWEAGPRRASQAAKRLACSVVDPNELRVCLPPEMRAMFGARYPLGMERARRMRSALQDIFERENCVTLDPLASLPAQEARHHLLAIPGVGPFVAARVTLMGLGGRAIPIDGRIARALRQEGALPVDVRADDAGAWAERHVCPADLTDTYLRLERWADAPVDGAGECAGDRAGDGGGEPDEEGESE